MVSNVLEVDEADLVKQLRSFAKKYSGDAEYKKLRAQLPKDWPF
jgi:hypothetical protein